MDQYVISLYACSNTLDINPTPNGIVRIEKNIYFYMIITIYVGALKQYVYKIISKRVCIILNIPSASIIYITRIE